MALACRSSYFLCLAALWMFGSDVVAQDIDIEKWQITMPIGKPKKPLTVVAKGYSKKPWFYKDGDHWVFRTPVGGVTTGGSKYPRTEMREADGKKKLAWSTTKGKHVMEFEASVEAWAKKKQDMCVGQLHDDKDDFAQFRFRKGEAQVIYYGNTTITVEKPYKLGTKFKGKMVAEKGTVALYYNDKLIIKYPLKDDNVYYKLGSYIHTNPSFGDDPKDYGEVWVYWAKIER